MGMQIFTTTNNPHLYPNLGSINCSKLFGCGSSTGIAVNPTFTNLWNTRQATITKIKVVPIATYILGVNAQNNYFLGCPKISVPHQYSVPLENPITTASLIII